MRFLSLAGWALSISAQVAALPSPVPQAGNGAGSCPAEALTAATWNKLDIDKFLVNWAKSNVTNAASNNVQALAQSFGAPNFFCGLDKFCNAGQPCLPVRPPAWYALLAIQNWNSYMNSLNTAISFASSILSLTLPGLVTDLKVKPKDDVTLMKNLYKMFTTVLAMIPLTGTTDTVAGGVGQGITFIMLHVKPPKPRDSFVVWSDVAGQMGNVVTDYQAQVAASFQAVLDAPLNDANAGIFKIVSKGAFLGQSRNVTEAEVQKSLIGSFKVYGAALVLQAQGAQLSVSNSTNPANGNSCRDSAAGFGVAASCREDGNGAWRQVVLVDRDGYPQNEIMQTLIDKYGITQDMATQDAVDCINNGTPDPTNDTVPLDPKAKCLFTLPLQPPPKFP